MSRQKLAAKARTFFAEERAGIEVGFDRLDALLSEVEADPTAHGAMKEALDLAFELSGSCEALSELADSIGYVDEDAELAEQADELRKAG